jgi:hypothetical protein
LSLLSEDINWEAQTICITRKKLKGRAGSSIKPTLVRFCAEIETFLKRRPANPVKPLWLARYAALKCQGPLLPEKVCDQLELKQNSLFSAGKLGE